MLKAFTRLMSKKPVQPAWHQPPAVSGPVLKLYNSLTRTKEVFVPQQDRHVSWYCCGPTVYNHSHMGHARNYVCLDLCRRILQNYFHYNVTFVQNVTDIDDKIIVAARQQHLFDTRVRQAYTLATEPLRVFVERCLAEYVHKHFPGFQGAVESDLPAYLDSPAWAAVLAEDPKAPMHAAAAKRAHAALYGAEQPFDGFLAAIEDVAMPVLDREHGLLVTDPEVFRKLAAYWEARFNDDMARLNVLPPTVTTRVSEYVPEIVAFVGGIIANQFAYATSDGSVYFDTVAFEAHPDHDYAKLQPWNKGKMDLIADGEGSLLTGALKKNAADFALWKASKPGEPAWDSPWGPGRPGWHIECSVMASDVLGPQIDIHLGGVDLCFPHHDNELAQSEAYFDSRQWINYFMHNGHLHIQGQKMSKSLKNFITIDEALQTYTARQLRLAFAFGNWDRPIDFKDLLVQEVRAYESTLAKFFTTVRALANDQTDASKKLGPAEKQLVLHLQAAQTAAHAAFCDNLLTPVVLRVLGDLVSKTNLYIQTTVVGTTELRLEPVLAVTHWVVSILDVLGFEARADRLGWVDALAQTTASEDAAMPYVKALAQFRDLMREMAIAKADSGSFLKACDTLRSELVHLGVSLDDRPNGGALVKMLNELEKQELLAQQEAKDKQQAAKELKKQQQAEAAAKKEQERLEKMKVLPQEMFRDPLVYSEWDEQGLPTKNAAGEEVTKSMRKKLAKQQQQQEKLHAEYLAKQ